MPKSIDRGDAWHHDVARLDHGGAVGERHNDLHIKLAVELARLAHVLALVPEIELGGAEYVAGVREHRLSALGQAADMIGMTVRDDHDVDILRLVAGLRHARDQLARRQAAFELLVLGRERAIAGIEQHQLLAGIDHRRREWMEIAVGVDAVGGGQRLHFVGMRFAAERGRQPRADHMAVHDGRDFETAKLEAVDIRQHFTLHCSGHACPPLVLSVRAPRVYRKNGEITSVRGPISGALALAQPICNSF